MNNKPTLDNCHLGICVKSLLFILLELFHNFSSSAQDCDKVLRDGIFNTTSINSSLDATKTLNEYIYASDFSTHQQAIDAGLSVGMVIYGVPLEIGGTFSKEQKDEWRRINQQYRNETSSVAEKYNALMKFASAELLDAWNRCIENVVVSRVGLSGWIQELDPSLAILHITWIPMAGDTGPAPKVTGSSVVGGYRSDNPNLPILPINYTLIQGANGNLVSLTRKPTESLIIVINTTRGDVSCILKAFPKPIISLFSLSKSRINEGETASLTWNVSNKPTHVNIDNGIGDVQPNGSITLTPSKNTTYKITAANNSGSVSSFVTIYVTPIPPPPPVLVSASVVFNVTDDDKDGDTRVSVYVKSGGNTVAQWSGTDGHWNDNSTHGPYGFTIVERIRKDQLIGPGQAVLVESPNGHDEWHFNWNINLNFSDGSQKQYNWAGNVDYDRNTLTNPLP